MLIKDLLKSLELYAPALLQEDYDNAGLITGNAQWNCTGVLICLDATEAIVKEAIKKDCNLIVAHHPIVFRGLKKINGKNYVEKAVITAIKNDVAIYAIHTNLDNVIAGVNARIADKLALTNRRILAPKQGLLQKLAVYVPHIHKPKLMEALFAAGAGNIANYSECSFSMEGMGSFKANAKAHPFIGKPNERHNEPESRLEVIFPAWLQAKVLAAMRQAHPYEEVAFDLYPLANTYQEVGSGLVGELKKPIETVLFLENLKKIFKVPVVRHTRVLKKKLRKVAVCGGAGSFLTGTAIALEADIFITSDIKYHEFFEADDRLVLADIGHYESEQFTIDLLFDVLKLNFPTFAVQKTALNSNPVRYLI